MTNANETKQTAADAAYRAHSEAHEAFRATMQAYRAGKATKADVDAAADRQRAASAAFFAVA